LDARTSGLVVDPRIDSDGLTASWSRDGKWLAVFSTVGSTFAPTPVLSLRAADTGNVLRELKPHLWDWPAQPTPSDLLWSPDGTEILLTGESDHGPGIQIVNVLSGDVTTVLEGAFFGSEGYRLMGDGWLGRSRAIVYRRGGRGALMARDVDTGAERLLCEGDPRASQGRRDGPGPNSGEGWPVGVAGSGDRVFCPRLTEDPKTIAIVERTLPTGQERELARIPNLLGTRLEVSPNGGTIIARSGAGLVAIALTGRSDSVRLSSSSVRQQFVAWTPDGQHVLVREPDGNRFVLASPIGDEARELSGVPDRLRTLTFHPNGKDVVLAVSGAAVAAQVRVIDLRAAGAR